ncbi:MAG: hypothetical protein ACREHD_22460, partial [Pirellulales bacterium]
RVNKHGGNDADETGTLKVTLSGTDLLEALTLYNESIRLNDQLDEAHRGRAEALRLLATAPRFIDAKELCGEKTCQAAAPGTQFRDRLCGNDAQKENARREAVDAAYESATTASFLRNNRDAKSLQTRGEIEIERSRLVGANLGLLEIARASETFKDALIYAKTTADRETLNKRMGNLDTVSYFALGFAGAVNDAKFALVRNRAEKMKDGVKLLYGKLTKLREDQYQALAITIARAHRAVTEIDEIEPLEERKSNPIRKLLQALSAVVTPSAQGSPHSRTYQEPWPTALPIKGELMARNPKIDAWDLMLDRLVEVVDSQLRTDAEASSRNGPTSPVYQELAKCSRDWRGLKD